MAVMNVIWSATGHGGNDNIDSSARLIDRALIPHNNIVGRNCLIKSVAHMLNN